MSHSCIFITWADKHWASSLSPSRQLSALFSPSFPENYLLAFPRDSLSRTRSALDPAMWRRNSLSLSSKLASPNSNPSLLLLLRSSPKSHHHGLLARSNSTSPESTSAADPVSWVQSGPEVPYFGPRPSASDFPSLAATAAVKAKEVADLAKHYGRCYWELSKARLSGSSIDYLGLCCTCAGTMMVAASANSLNQVFEVKNDAKMNRTKRRPLPSGRITIPHAVTWASSMGVAGTALLACQANMLAAGLAASNLGLYAFVYTPLKQIHPINTWVGAVVGAIPPLLGWAAASGQISLNGMILPAALYFWQIPHFMALAYLCRKDYADGGYVVLQLFISNTHQTITLELLFLRTREGREKRTVVVMSDEEEPGINDRSECCDNDCLCTGPLCHGPCSSTQVSSFSMLTVDASYTLTMMAVSGGITSGWFCVESTLLALAISCTAGSFYLNRTTHNARRMFHASLLYLPVFMGGLLVHRLSDSEQSATVDNRDQLNDLSSSSETIVGLTENAIPRKNRRPAVVGTPAQSPVAYASVAPFPFLPAPSYVSS
ncbi:UNVERIFIED_CONTAM: Protoheme IX farnesyltransferase, mitochondrial [Sesamum radiatum]|uniref:Heme O synthase n=1 Tax=Sesamum radiatum TaxID=300843 RepID=A0AAW2V6T1_SESRA